MGIVEGPGHDSDVLRMCIGPGHVVSDLFDSLGRG